MEEWLTIKSSGSQRHQLNTLVIQARLIDFSVDFNAAVTLTYHDVLFVLNVLEAHALNLAGLILIAVIENFHDEHRFQQRVVH